MTIYIYARQWDAPYFDNSAVGIAIRIHIHQDVSNFKTVGFSRLRYEIVLRSPGKRDALVAKTGNP